MENNLTLSEKAGQVGPGVDRVAWCSVPKQGSSDPTTELVAASSGSYSEPGPPQNDDHVGRAGLHRRFRSAVATGADVRTKRAEHGWVRRMGYGAVAAGLILAVAGVATTPASANHIPGKTTICHRTNSNTNPYVVISPDTSAVDGAAPAKGDHFLEHVGSDLEPDAQGAAHRVGGHHPACPGSPRWSELDRRGPGHLRERLQPDPGGAGCLRGAVRGWRAGHHGHPHQHGYCGRGVRRPPGRQPGRHPGPAHRHGPRGRRDDQPAADRRRPHGHRR